MPRRALLVAAILLAVLSSATPTLAAKLKGFVWDVQDSSLVVEGVRVTLGSWTKIERKNHKGISPDDLRIGWEVEVEGEEGGDGLDARKIKVKTERFRKVKINGYVEEVDGKILAVEGRKVLSEGMREARQIVPGMKLKGKGILLDDGSVQLSEFEVSPRGLEKGERDFLTLASKELERLKEGLVFYEGRLFQEYVNRVGHRLVPDWVDRDELKFSFSIVDDPDLNAFALPDGTVVIHSGLLAVLENEAQLAAVLGHEIAHVTHKHGYRGYRRAQKMQWLVLGAAVAGAAIEAGSHRKPWEGPSVGRILFEVGATLALAAAMNGHGRNLEDDADRIGLHYAVEAGYDPYQAPEVWRIFSRHTRDQNTVANWFFSNHSTHRARISNLTREINGNYRGEIDEDSLRRSEREYEGMVHRLRRHNAIRDYERKEYKNAEDAFRRILENDPEDARSHVYLGKIIWDTGGAATADGALAEFQTAMRLDPQLPDPHREMGFLYYGLGDRQRSVASFRTYLAMAPHAPDAAEIREYLTELSR
ncbi:MAG: tetratricopeptide repeat protein [Acidobacteriota bacterium]